MSASAAYEVTASLHQAVQMHTAIILSILAIGNNGSQVEHTQHDVLLTDCPMRINAPGESSW